MSSMRSTSVGVMRPPKPPCWRDFVVTSARGPTATETVDALHDQSGRLLGARSSITDLIELAPGSRPAAIPAASGSRPGRLIRRPRAKIHRTRSEHVILPEDLPDTSWQNPALGTSAALEEVAPSLRSRPHALTPDGQLYVEENNKRCQNWLASIEAAEPLDEVDYNTDRESTVDSIELVLDHSIRRDSDSLRDLQVVDDISFNSESGVNKNTDKDLSTGLQQQATVEMEIPEETFYWVEDIFLTSRGQKETQPRVIVSNDSCPVCKRSAKTGTTSATAPGSSRKFPAPPLCGACTDCISCGSGEPLSSAASDNNTRTEHAKTVEDSRYLCTCLDFPTATKTSNTRSNLRKNRNSKTSGYKPSTKDRITSSPAVTRSSGSILHRGGGMAGESSNAAVEMASKSGPWQQTGVRSPGATRRTRSVSRRRASQRNVFRNKDSHL